ncbi:NAD(+)--rifampin ADP-ribosyltransferase [Demequina gelatinilytica]|uniref:NAD(+)--rifampin ADP-ribosyltransferase n=1 Tax=Demequina gelatinilytica TaxID=1638980 RepID=UPI0007857366|nr:NAD(+)--rifampin ADP-ribosyltransferase [Demequina gelatinilytica]
MSGSQPPVPFEVFGDGTAYLHGTKAALSIGDVLEPGRESNFRPGAPLRHVYVTQTLDAATWGAELAAGDGPGRIYLVEPLGEIEDDPNVTDKRFPGNPTRSFRTLEPVRVVGELDDWIGHPPEQVQAMRDGIAGLEARGENVIED